MERGLLREKKKTNLEEKVPFSKMWEGGGYYLLGSFFKSSLGGDPGKLKKREQTVEKSLRGKRNLGQGKSARGGEGELSTFIGSRERSFSTQREKVQTLTREKHTF